MHTQLSRCPPQTFPIMNNKPVIGWMEPRTPRAAPVRGHMHMVKRCGLWIGTFPHAIPADPAGYTKVDGKWVKTFPLVAALPVPAFPTPRAPAVPEGAATAKPPTAPRPVDQSRAAVRRIQDFNLPVKDSTSGQRSERTERTKKRRLAARE